jgi:hypothetical protein
MNRMSSISCRARVPIGLCAALLLALLAGCGSGGSGAAANGPGNGGNPGGNGSGDGSGNGPGLPAGILVYEGFDYPVGTDLEDRQGGTGFEDRWIGPPNGAGFNGFADIEAGSLTAGSLQTTGNSVMLHAVQVPVTYDRTLSGTLGAPGTTAWMSVVMQGTAPGNSGGVLVGTLTADPDRPPPGALLVGDPASSDTYGLERSQSLMTPGASASSNLSVSSRALLVVRMRFAEGVDTFDLFVNPTPGTSAPAAPDATLRFDLGRGQGRLSLFGGGGEGGGAAHQFDEVRFGDSFAAVAPAR